VTLEKRKEKKTMNTTSIPGSSCAYTVATLFPKRKKKAETKKDKMDTTSIRGS